jgi:hypothetical protein
MPLDGFELFEDPSLAKLRRVERLLATEDQWCKGRLYDRKGRRCLAGAISQVDGRQVLTRPITRAVREVSGKHYWRIESFNDDPNTSHRDVLRVLQRARLLILSEIASVGQPKSWKHRLADGISALFPAIGIGMHPYGTGLDDLTAMPIPARVRSAAGPDEYRGSLRPVRETSDLCR